ncbi:MAG TPA: Ig-like domain-containing protein [Gemmatimonadaceae bacterium]|nr:Ig-like domain-containing protein [Gemmatimonadaceae bacterium]
MTHHPRIAGRLALVLGLLLVSGCNSSDSSTQPTAAVVASVTVTGVSTLQAGKTSRFTAAALDSTGAVVSGKTFTWASDNESVASVASDGTVTAHVPGSAGISASVDGRSGTAQVGVSP